MDWVDEKNIQFKESGYTHMDFILRNNYEQKTNLTTFFA